MPVAEDREQEIINYKMPEIRVGAPVLWFANGSAMKEAILGWVTKLGHRGIRVHLCTGVWYDSVRHMSDPKLKMNQDQRENGAWDYTEDYRFQEEIKNLQGLVKQTDARHIDAMAKLQEEHAQAIKLLKAQVNELMAQMVEFSTPKEDDPAPEEGRQLRNAEEAKAKFRRKAAENAKK